jgi:hypothetical protein
MIYNIILNRKYTNFAQYCIFNFINDQKIYKFHTLERGNIFIEYTKSILLFSFLARSNRYSQIPLLSYYYLTPNLFLFYKLYLLPLLFPLFLYLPFFIITSYLFLCLKGFLSNPKKGIQRICLFSCADNGLRFILFIDSLLEILL